MSKDVVALTRRGWSHIQLTDIVKLQKEWEYENETFRADAFFGRARDGRQTPIVIMNVYEQGAGTTHIVDDNCDVWDNMFTSMTKEDGNEFFKYLKKHGFQRVDL